MNIYTEQEILTVEDLRQNVIKMLYIYIYTCNSLAENMTAKKLNIKF